MGTIMLYIIVYKYTLPVVDIIYILAVVNLSVTEIEGVCVCMHSSEMNAK